MLTRHDLHQRGYEPVSDVTTAVRAAFSRLGECSIHALRRPRPDRHLIFPASLIELAAGAAGAAPPKLDLHVIDPCPKGSSDEIVVCGSREPQSRYRLPKLPHIYDRKPLRAEADIGGAHARAQVGSQVRPDGLVDKRVMITFTAPF